MKVEIFYVDAFTDVKFSGNPAAIIFSGLNDENIMQQIASENNLSETAFIDLDNNNNIRWFSPSTEVNLCGHATLASAFIYFNYINQGSSNITFNSASGPLHVYKKKDFLQLDFPKDKYEKVNLFDDVEESLGAKPIEIHKGEINLLAIFEKTDFVNINPQFEKIKNLTGQGLIVSSIDDKYDFISRYFCPKYGIDEDPVTGSAHTTLIPYWSDKLGKNELVAKQVSKRGGELYCINGDDRVLIGGNACLYMRGFIDLT